MILNAGQHVSTQVELHSLYMVPANSSASKSQCPYPPNVKQKMQAADQSLISSERFAQQVQKIVNGELQSDKGGGELERDLTTENHA
jgi:hypothetical protein